MRCLVVADLHYSLPQFDWLLSAAPQFDVVIFAGDALDIASLVDFRAQIVVVRKYLTLLSGITRVILCSGNHDLSVVGWTAGQAADRQPAARGGRRTVEAVDMGSSRAAREFPDQLGRQAFFRRRRTCAMDRELSAVDGDLGSRASIAIHPRRLVVRSARQHMGV